METEPSQLPPDLSYGIVSLLNSKFSPSVAVFKSRLKIHLFRIIAFR